MRFTSAFCLKRKNALVILVCVIIVLLVFYKRFLYSDREIVRENNYYLSSEISLGNSYQTLPPDVHAYFERRKHWETSNLGSILFKYNLPQYHKGRNNTFVILIWRYWDWLKHRHLSDRKNGDPFDQCSVNNCVVSSNERDLTTADAVVVHVQHGVLPSTKGRRAHQRWVFLSDESPLNAFSMAGKKPQLDKWAHVFNWSMTYRSDSDVPVPYGRTIPVKSNPFKDSQALTDRIPFWSLKQKAVLAAALISHCQVKKRMNYIKTLQNYMEIDIYGKCSEKNLSCPGHFRQDCRVINKYIFYLAFENTKCRQYLTEKIFYNAYAKGAIPVIMGPCKKDCDNLLPPQSYLHVDNYPNAAALAEDMKSIARNESRLLMYHHWRQHYQLLNEHGFFQTKSYHLCRLCEALNYNDQKPKTYSEDDLKMFFEPKLLCDQPDLY